MQSGIGLNSGPVIGGNMGSTPRFNYTMMGDNVNLAAGMESGAKSWGVYSMCTDATKNACEEHGGDRVVFRAPSRIVVKGRSTAFPIFEIVGLKENVCEKRGAACVYLNKLWRYTMNAIGLKRWSCSAKAHHWNPINPASPWASAVTPHLSTLKSFNGIKFHLRLLTGMANM